MKRSLALFLCLASGVALCQLPTSTLIGRVSDPRQASVASASVTVTNQAHDISLTATTDSEGRYSFPLLKAGTYSLSVQSPNFAEIRVPALTLEAGKIQTCDVSLVLASAKESVVVNTSSETIDTSQSMIQGRIDSKAIESIPLNGRNFLELAYLIPGNRPAPTFDPTKTNTLEVSSAGGFGRGGNITVDGGDNNDEVVGGTLANFPEDSIQEFQIATARFTSEVGRSACPAAFPCLAGGQLQNVPANINFFSPFSSLDFRLKKDFAFGEKATLSLMAESFNIFNETNIRGTTNNNYAGRNLSIGPYQPAQNGQPAQAVQNNFYSAVSTAGGFFGSGGPRAFQFAARLAF